MSFEDLFRKDRPHKMPQITPSRLVAAFNPNVRPGGVGLGGGHRRALGALVLFWRRRQATPASA